MSATSMLAAAGAAAVGAAVVWWLLQGARRWRSAVGVHRIMAYHASLRAEMKAGYERIYTRCAARPTWSTQKLADMEWAFAQIDYVLERRRLEDLAEVGRIVSPIASPVVPAVLGVAGAASLVAALLAGR